MKLTEYWQWGQGAVESAFMSEDNARYWANRQNQRVSSVDNPARVRKILVADWEDPC